MHDSNRNSDRRGAALLLCVAFTAAAVSMVAVLSTRSVAHARQAESAALIAAAFSAAEVGQAQALADLRSGGTGSLGYSGTGAWDDTATPTLPNFGDPDVQPRGHAGPTAVQWFTVAHQPPGLPQDVFVIYAIARAGQVERRLETLLQRSGAGDLRVLTWRELPPAQREAPANADL